MKVKFTPAARDQFLSAVRRIYDDNPRAAREFRKKVEHKLARLKNFPKSGRSLPEFPELPHREVIIPPYRFFYREEGKVEWVVAVWHGAQEPTSPIQ